MGYRYPDPLPIIEYTADENKTWGLVFTQLEEGMLVYACYYACVYVYIDVSCIQMYGDVLMDIQKFLYIVRVAFDVNMLWFLYAPS